MKAFGYDEDDLEEDWDENMDLAEAEVTEAQGRLDAMDVDLDAMTEEELEAWENSVTPTLQSTEDAFGGQDIDDIIASRARFRRSRTTGRTFGLGRRHPRAPVRVDRRGGRAAR